MNHSGDAAEQVIRFSLEGVEYTLRIAGPAAKHIAAFLLALTKTAGGAGIQKVSQRARLKAMLNSGKALKVITIKSSDLETFTNESKRYGMKFLALKNVKQEGNEGTTELMVTEDSAALVSRIMDKLEMATVDLSAADIIPEPKKRDVFERDSADEMIDALISKDGKPKTDEPETEKALEAGETKENPTKAGQEAENRSKPRLKTQSQSAEATMGTKLPKSVKGFLQERTAQNKKRQEEKQTKRTEPETQPKSKTKPPQHKQPQTGGRRKPKPKERS